MRSVFSRIYGGLASLKLTIVLLSVLAAVLIYGTFYESANGTPMAQRHVYASKWFDALIVLLAANMVACTAKRYPYKPHQLGFLMVHCGILTILTGAMLTRNFGREGELFLFEGETGQAITSARPSLQVDVPAAGIASFQIPVVFPARDEGAEVDEEVRLPHGAMRLRMLRYYPNAQWTNTVTEGEELNPALRMRWTQHDVPGESWLVPSDPQRRSLAAPFRIDTFAAASGREADSLLATAGRAQPQGRGTLRLRLASQPLAEIPLDGPVPRRVHAGDYEVVLREWFSHFVLREGKPTNASADMVNPALLFDISNKGSTENHVVFAFHEMGSLLSTSGNHGFGIEADYVYDGPAANESRMVLVHAPGTGWRAAANFDLGLPADGRLEVGRAYGSDASHVEIAIAETLDRAAVRNVLVNVDRQERNPAVLVQAVSKDGTSDPQWVVAGEQQTLRLGDREMTLQFARREYPLGFSVHLVDFIETTYPGTSRSATYASDVMVSDGTHPAVPIHISMNKPLKHKGFRLFQSSFMRSGGQEASVFSVSYDPGVHVVYTGFIIFIAGMVAIFYLKPVIRRAYLRSTTPQAVIPDTAVLERT